MAAASRQALCLAAVRGFADDVDVGLALKNEAKPGSHQALVIGDQDANHA